MISLLLPWKCTSTYCKRASRWERIIYISAVVPQFGEVHGIVVYFASSYHKQSTGNPESYSLTGVVSRSVPGLDAPPLADNTWVIVEKQDYMYHLGLNSKGKNECNQATRLKTVSCCTDLTSSSPIITRRALVVPIQSGIILPAQVSC